VTAFTEGLAINVSRIRCTLSGPTPGDASPGYKATPDKSGLLIKLNRYDFQFSENL
jgi:hypothetical protein